MKPWFFAVVNVIISDILPESFNEITQVLRKVEDFLQQYYLFSSIFRIFWYFLVTKKLITSASNRYFQSTLNRLLNNWIKLY